MSIKIINHCFGYIIIELCEYINNGIECVITCCCHPFDFLYNWKNYLKISSFERNVLLQFVYQVISYYRRFEKRHWIILATNFECMYRRNSSWFQTSQSTLWNFLVKRSSNGLLNFYLVRTSNLHRLIMQDNSNRTGNQPFTQTRSSSGTLIKSSPACSRKIYWKQTSRILRKKIESIPVVFLQHILRIVELIELLPWMYQEMKHYMQIPINISLRLENYQVPMEIVGRIPHLRNGIIEEIVYGWLCFSYQWYVYRFEKLIQQFVHRYQRQPFERRWKYFSNLIEYFSLENQQNVLHNEQPYPE